MLKCKESSQAAKHTITVTPSSSCLRLTHNHHQRHNISTSRGAGRQAGEPFVQYFFFCHSRLIYLVIITTTQPQKQSDMMTRDIGFDLSFIWKLLMPRIVAGCPRIGTLLSFLAFSLTCWVILGQGTCPLKVLGLPFGKGANCIYLLVLWQEKNIRTIRIINSKNAAVDDHTK